MMSTMRRIVFPASVVVILLLVACGSGGQDTAASSFLKSTTQARDGGIEFAEAPVEVVVEREVTKEVLREAPVERMVPAAAPPGPVATKGSAADEATATATLVSQQRIIVRTVDMELVVADLPSSVEAISDLVEQMGGRVVSTSLREKHRGSISVRVPAGQLDTAVSRLREMAIEIKSEVSTSRDVTDEHVDLVARLRNQEATEVALLKLFDKAEKVEDALEVQRSLTQVQGEIERLKGRINLIEETAAFSLVNVSLELEPAELDVDAGVDVTSGIRQVVRFRATFKLPEGIEDFVYTWDFGDGSPEIISTRTALTETEDSRVTATVTHVYGDERDSPYFAEVKITGTGEAGVAEGEDTVTVTVTRVPTIEVFAGEAIVADEGEEVELSGSFTRPEGVRELTFEWDFGDGTAPATGVLGTGATTADATHVYADHRPFPFTATLTMTGQSDGGEVEASGSVPILVEEAQGWTLGGWSFGDSSKDAVRALSGVGQGIASVLIWAAILSPVWIVVGIVGVLAARRARWPWRRRAEAKS